MAADLLQDLADESYYLTSADIAARARSIGFSVRPEERAVALVVGDHRHDPGVDRGQGDHEGAP